MKQNSWARIAVILLCALLFVGVLVVNALAGAGRGEMRRTRLKTFWGFFFFICYALISACCLHNIDTLETLRKVMKEEQGVGGGGRCSSVLVPSVSEHSCRSGCGIRPSSLFPV